MRRGVGRNRDEILISKSMSPTYFNLLTILGKINEPGAVVIGAVVVGEVGRNDGLSRADDASATRYPVAGVESYSGYR